MNRWVSTGRRRAIPILAVFAVLAAMLAVAVPVWAGQGPNYVNWSTAGHDLKDTRYQNTEDAISASNVSGLVQTWVFTTAGDVSATPAVDDSMVYVPDGAGNLYALDRATGAQVWSKKVSDYTGVSGDVAGATPAVAGSRLILGTQGPFGGSAFVLAVDKRTGALLWKTQVDAHPFASVTQSAIVDGNTVYVGVSSSEGAAASIPGYPCCSFRGSFLALDVKTGAIQWKTYTVPEGYSGGDVWGSTAAIRSAGKTVTIYITTGSNYSVPQDVLDCVAAGGSFCASPADHFDSVLALNAATGQINWATTTVAYDAWNFDCLFGGSNCPQTPGPSFDFGQGPALFTIKGSKPLDLVGAGQESGKYWTLDAATGAVAWSTQAGPAFGVQVFPPQGGSAVDGNRIYTANASSSGGWSALDPRTGAILWQTAPPNGGGAAGPVTTANGVVFGCALDASGHMVAMSAATGSILWDFASGGSCVSGAAISKGAVYWGSGASNFGLGTPNNKLYAFSLGGA